MPNKKSKYTNPGTPYPKGNTRFNPLTGKWIPGLKQCTFCEGSGYHMSTTVPCGACDGSGLKSVQAQLIKAECAKEGENINGGRVTDIIGDSKKKKKR